MRLCLISSVEESTDVRANGCDVAGSGFFFCDRGESLLFIGHSFSKLA